MDSQIQIRFGKIQPMQTNNQEFEVGFDSDLNQTGTHLQKIPSDFTWQYHIEYGLFGTGMPLM